ncbi:unnamed protein product [Rotaria sp. Silwood1]|nr:unnamed protein product [Rotaria sp. Silwood1]CAF3746492.1 unnamed protein product [Rotaria sp. Silwood1]CAF5019812.1 unnamed protein product [Rotaria sp. Silwood1]
MDNWFYMNRMTFENVLNNELVCGKIICNKNCVPCSFNPPTYAKLAWFVQRLLITNPIRNAFIKQTALLTLLKEDPSFMKDKNVTNHITIPCDSTEENSLAVNEDENDRNIRIQESFQIQF